MRPSGLRLLFSCGLLFLAACARPQAPPESAQVDTEDPMLSFQTPYRNVRADVKYVGDEACAGCHVTHTQNYRQHPMGRSLIPIANLAAQERFDKTANNPFDKLGYHFVIERRANQVFHKELRLDTQGKVVTELDAEVLYALGSGARGRSYLIDHEGFVFQSPISWYSQKAIWDLSPGYEKNYQMDRPVTAQCLYCHSNECKPVEDSVNRFQRPLFRGTAIGCERCHGPGELHVQSRLRGNTAAGVDDTIVNPRHLQPELRDAVCEQCHLQGEIRILRRGRLTYDYRPGLPLEWFWAIFQSSPTMGERSKAVSQVEQMYGSQCYKGSQGKLGCISCHDPHLRPAAEQRVAFYRDRCQQCHAQQPCSLSLEVRRRKSKEDSCIDCHMPRLQSPDIAHTALSDHRILRKPAPRQNPRPPQQPLGDEVPLVAFHHGYALPEKEAQRDVGVAIIQLARQMKGSEPRIGRMAQQLLEKSVQTWPEDVPAWEAKSYALWMQGRAGDAFADCEKVLTLAPERELALIDAAMLADQLERAEATLDYARRAAAINPWRHQLHYHLAVLLAKRQDWPSALAETQSALRLNPSNVEYRVLLVTCYLRSGDKEKARHEFQTLLALHPPGPDVLRRWFEEQIQ
jgi:cytochrome c-type biogenesis protein CcmH/NrfG